VWGFSCLLLSNVTEVQPPLRFEVEPLKTFHRSRKLTKLSENRKITKLGLIYIFVTVYNLMFFKIVFLLKNTELPYREEAP